VVSKNTAKPARAVKSGAIKRFDAKFLRDTYSELRKVVWPTRQEATKLTGIVIAVSVAIGIMLGAIDFIFFWMVNTVILGVR
jgi:preprotein translocase subunit SecE